MTGLKYEIELSGEHLKREIEYWKENNVHNGYGTSLTNSTKKLFIEYLERMLEKMDSLKGKKFASLENYKKFCEKEFPQIRQTIIPSVRLTETNLKLMKVKHFPIIWEHFGNEYCLGQVEVICE